MNLTLLVSFNVCNGENNCNFVHSNLGVYLGRFKLVLIKFKIQSNQI